MTFISQFSLFFSERWEIISELWLSFLHFWFFNFIWILKIFSLHFTTVFAHKELCNLHYNLTIVTFFSVYIWQISEIMASRNPEFTSFSLNPFQNSKLISQFWLIYSEFTFYAFSRWFYPKRLTIAFRLYIFNQYLCSLGIEPTTFCAANVMLYHWATQEHCVFHRILWKKSKLWD